MKEGTWHHNTSSFLPGTLNTVNEGNPATLSSPNTHPLTSGSFVPRARPPNLPGKERPLHLTNSAQRLEERDYRHCVRKTAKKEYPHFLPIQRRCCSIPPHVSQVRRRDTVRPKGIFLSHHAIIAPWRWATCERAAAFQGQKNRK